MVADKTRVLIVEDDDELAALLMEFLGLHGFELIRVASGLDGIAAIRDAPPDLVILDLMLPGANGLDVLRQVRADYAGAILMLTASQSEVDHVAGLELGADDFVIKPVQPRVLLARIRTQMRRLGSARPTPSANENIISLGALRIDIASRDVAAGEATVPLTSMEFDVLLMLAQAAGTVVRRDDLYTEVLGIEYDGIDRGMDVHISRIRRKLKRVGFDAGKLKSVRGVGYLLAAR